MKVILLHDIKKVGKKYEVKDVSNGYALNLLIPKGLAEVATPASEKRLAVVKSRIDAETKINHELLVKNLKDLAGVVIEMKEKVNEKGHLFAGIHKEDIVKALKAQSRVDVAKEYIDLEKPIKELGEHTINVKVGEHTASFKLNVASV